MKDKPLTIMDLHVPGFKIVARYVPRLFACCENDLAVGDKDCKVLSRGKGLYPAVGRTLTGRRRSLKKIGVRIESEEFLEPVVVAKKDIHGQRPSLFLKSRAVNKATVNVAQRAS